MCYLKEKIDAGADFIVTQFFYDADVFLSYVARCRAAGITCPIIPGLMPIHVRVPWLLCGDGLVDGFVGVDACGSGPFLAHVLMPLPTQPLPPHTQTYRTFERMTSFCKTKVPPEMWEELRPIKEDDEAVKNWGILYMTKLCRCAFFVLFLILGGGRWWSWSWL